MVTKLDPNLKLRNKDQPGFSKSFLVSQDPHLGQDHCTEEALDVGLVRDLFPADRLDDLAKEVEGEELELRVVVGVGDQALNLGDAGADVAPDDVALVVLVSLKTTTKVSILHRHILKPFKPEAAKSVLNSVQNGKLFKYE